MNKSKIISVDLAKDVFEVAIADSTHRIQRRKRLNRKEFSKLIRCESNALFLFEACGTAHHWGRTALAAGHQVRILPVQHVVPYRRRNKTDRADAEALLEANRCAGLIAVPVRSVEQQQLLLIHRLREQWKKTRTARINTLRGCLRELGITISVGARRAIAGAHETLDSEAVPQAFKVLIFEALEEIPALEHRIHVAETQLKVLTQDLTDVARLGQVEGIGLLTSTALFTAAGSPNHFRSGRHMSAWLGITPRVSSSANTCHLGPITKRGDKYLRTLVVHGARGLLSAAKRRQTAGSPLSRLHRWALQLEARVGHNKATVAIANKIVRIAWAVWKKQEDFRPGYLTA